MSIVRMKKFEKERKSDAATRTNQQFEFGWTIGYVRAK